MTKNSQTLVAVILASVAAASGCGGGSKTTPAPPPSTGGAASTSSVAAGDFGVPECDQYMKKYMACIDGKVPDMVKPTLKTAFEQQKDAWKKAASTPEGKAGLANACTQMEAQSKAAMQAYGCSW